MVKRSILWIAVVGFCVWFCGCYNDILDPTQIGRFEPTPTVMPILDTLGVADETSSVYEGAEEPRPEDLVPIRTDYVFGPGDVVRISIFELFQEGSPYLNDFIITESGRVSIPDVGLVHASGLTEVELEREIASILSPSIIKNPSVTVTLLNSQQKMFSIYGQGVAQSSRFPIPRDTTFRLTDAISVAGGVGDFNVSNIYVSRDVKVPEAEAIETGNSVDNRPSKQGYPDVEDHMLKMITPSDRRKGDGILITSAEMVTRDELEALAAPEGIESVDEVFEAGDDLESLLPEQKTTRIDWVFEDGKWIPVETQDSAEPSDLRPEVLRPEQYSDQQETSQPRIPSDFGLSDMAAVDTMTRVIQIPRDRLESGDPRFDIIIRPGDRISVPRDLVGEFWVTGNVNAPNAYTITGRPITLKQAIATAGGLNAIAWPKKVEVVRRIGKNKAGLMQEEIVLVDLVKISKGLQPDFFIKPYDYINVGTHGTSRWLAVLRNAFRATYGFGLVYDRNFAFDDFNDSPIVNPF